MNRALRAVALICASSLMTVTVVSPASAATVERNDSLRTHQAMGTCSDGHLSASSYTVEEAEAIIAAMSPEEQKQIADLEAELARYKAEHGEQDFIPAAILAAAGTCAAGALSGMGWGFVSQALAKLINWNGEGAYPTGTETVANAIVGCLTGGLGPVVWRFLPASVKAKAVGVVAGLIMKLHRW